VRTQPNIFFDRGHAHGALANVIGKWHSRITDEAQYSVGVKAVAAQQVGRD